MKRGDPECGCLGLGLAVFNRCEIQRCDSCDVYASDEEACDAASRLLDAMGAIREILFPGGNRDHDWGVETIEDVADAVLNATDDAEVTT